MAERGDGKKDADADSPERPPWPKDIYDPTILQKVTAEIEAEEKGIERPDGWIDLPELPKPPEKTQTAFWALRQLKRIVILTALVLLVSWGLKSLWKGIVFDKEKIGELGSVPLPKENVKEAEAEKKAVESLSEGRRLLASSDINSGIQKLIELAEEHPETLQGRKAMLTLAVTYRFQLHKPEDAIRWYRTFLKENPDGKDAPATMIRLADYFAELGRAKEARDVYQGVLDRFPQKVPQAELAKQALERLK